MAAAPMRGVRLPDELVTEAREARPELADLDLSRLLRVGLALVAGYELTAAIARSAGNKRGPAPKVAA